MKPRYHVKTYGCQMNYSDSERVSAVLENIGFEAAPSESEADFIIFNTCSIRQKAEDKVLGLMPQMQALKERNSRLMVAITGCMVQKSSSRRSKVQDDFLKKLDAVDLVFRIDELAKLPALVQEANPDVALAGVPDELDEGTLRNYFRINPKYTSKAQAFVPIMTGCDKFCAFCIVPYTRGRERSRALDEVFKECEGLVKNGCVEITLLGQNVNSYGLSAMDRRGNNFTYDDQTTGNNTWPWKIEGRSPFATLLYKIDSLKEKGLKRVRWTSPHPRDMTDDVIEAVATLKTQMPYIHLPIQAGNDEVLRRMNRPYTVDRYRDIIRKIRSAIPNCAISTDIIVGFCGETEEQFEDTCRLYEEIQWDMAYMGQYSMRRFTLASRTMKDDISPEEKQRRWHRLNAILTKVSREKHAQFVGKTVEVLVEKCEVQKEKGTTKLCEGRSEHFKKTQFPGTKDLVGKFVPIKIIKALDWNLTGEFAAKIK